MLREVEELSRLLIWLFNLGKTNFSSTVACEAGPIDLSGHVVNWYSRFTFLGTVITLCGNDNEAIRGRIKRVLPSCLVWSPLFTNKALFVAARMAALVASVLSSFCWQAQNWTATKNTTFTSALGLLASDHPSADSAVALMNPLTLGEGGFTKTETCWTKHSVDVVSAINTANSRSVGHIACMSVSDMVEGEQVKIHTNRGLPLHDSRFSAQHHWEGPLEVFSGHAVETQPEVLVRWMQGAQDRVGWKAS